MDFSQEKLLLLQNMLSNQQSTNDKNQLLQSLLSINQTAEKEGISFSDQETEAIIKEYTKDMSPAEKRKVDMIRTLARVMGQKNKK